MSRLALTPTEHELIVTLRSCSRATRTAIHHLVRKSAPELVEANTRVTSPAPSSAPDQVSLMEFRHRCLILASQHERWRGGTMREDAAKYLRFLETGAFPEEEGE